MNDLKSGEQAPERSSVGQVSCPDYVGRKLVPYFYRKGDTPAYIAVACDLRDGYAALGQAGHDVLDTIPDGVVDHGKFIDQYHLPFTLPAHSDTLEARAYGPLGCNKPIGREYVSIQQSSFLTDEHWRIERTTRDGRTRDHEHQIPVN